MSLILLDVGDDEPEIRRDEPFGGFFVAFAHPPRQLPLFSGIANQRKLLDVLQVLIEGSGRCRAKERFRLTGRCSGHALGLPQAWREEGWKRGHNIGFHV